MLVKTVFGSSVELSDMLEVGVWIMTVTLAVGLASTLASLRSSLKQKLSKLLK